MPVSLLPSLLLAILLVGYTPGPANVFALHCSMKNGVRKALVMWFGLLTGFRIACLQHIKRKFIDCMDAEPEAKEMVKLINKLYHEEHKHKIEENGWTVEDNFKWRQQYAPDILAEIRGKLDEILKKPDLLPDSELSDAASYFNNEWEAVVDIFKRGDTALDNNLVERMNRYFSMSRRSSLFFGSHKGAERAAVLYTLALSAKMNHLNFFDYLTDILDRTAQWQPNVPLENYRNLLPDRWQPSTKE